MRLNDVIEAIVFDAPAALAEGSDQTANDSGFLSESQVRFKTRILKKFLFIYLSISEVKKVKDISNTLIKTKKKDIFFSLN
jgi:hypothetical protein